jgi:release factor glutamine methyltransferase
MVQVVVERPWRRCRWGSLQLDIPPSVLAPRPWTEAQCAWAVALGGDGPALELCSGAGHIGLELARRTGRSVVQVDRSPVACRVARRNARLNGMGSRSLVICGELDGPWSANRRYSTVLADPPYIARADVSRFPDDPPLAIDGGPDGLDLVRRTVRVATRVVDAGGHLVLQLGAPEQVELAADLASTAFDPVGVQGHASDRWLLALRRRTGPGAPG